MHAKLLHAVVLGPSWTVWCCSDSKDFTTMLFFEYEVRLSAHAELASMPLDEGCQNMGFARSANLGRRSLLARGTESDAKTCNFKIEIWRRSPCWPCAFHLGYHPRIPIDGHEPALGPCSGCFSHASRAVEHGWGTGRRPRVPRAPETVCPPQSASLCLAPSAEACL